MQALLLFDTIQADIYLKNCLSDRIDNSSDLQYIFLSTQGFNHLSESVQSQVIQTLVNRLSGHTLSYDMTSRVCSLALENLPNGLKMKSFSLGKNWNVHKYNLGGVLEFSKAVPEIDYGNASVSNIGGVTVIALKVGLCVHYIDSKFIKQSYYVTSANLLTRGLYLTA